MTIELTPEMEAIVADRMSSGRYPSASAVIEEALHATEVRSETKDIPLLERSEREARARRMEKLFAEIDAAGPLEFFEIERDRTPPEERELW